MARLNLCSGCDKNFSSVTAHEKHRTGSFKNGERRCLTIDELLAHGFTMEVESITRYREGKASVVQMETWSVPLSEQQQEYFAALKAQRAQSEDELVEDL